MAINKVGCQETFETLMKSISSLGGEQTDRSKLCGLYTLSQMTDFRLFQTDDNLKFDKNGGKFS